MFSDLLTQEQASADGNGSMFDGADGSMFAGLLGQSTAGASGAVESTFLELNEEEERERGLVSMAAVADPSSMFALPTAPALSAADLAIEKEKTSVFTLGGPGSFLQRMSSTSSAIGGGEGAASSTDEANANFTQPAQGAQGNDGVIGSAPTPIASSEPPSGSVWNKMRAAANTVKEAAANTVKEAAADIQKMASEDGPSAGTTEQQQQQQQPQQQSGIFGGFNNKGVTFAMSPSKGSRQDEDAAQSPASHGAQGAAHAAQGRPSTMSGDLAGLDDTALRGTGMRRQGSKDATAVVEVVYPSSGSLFIDLHPKRRDTAPHSKSRGFGAIIVKFRQGDDGEQGAAELDGRLLVGDALVKVQSVAVENMQFEEIVNNLVQATRPLHLTFRLIAKRQEEGGDKRPPLLRHKSAPLEPITSMLMNPFPPADDGDDDDDDTGDGAYQPPSDANEESANGSIGSNGQVNGQQQQGGELFAEDESPEDDAAPSSPPATPGEPAGKHRRESSNPFDQLAAPPASSPGNPFGAKKTSEPTRTASEVIARDSFEKEAADRMSLPNIASSISAASSSPFVRKKTIPFVADPEPEPVKPKEKKKSRWGW
jgi:hypothetical protein